LKAPGIPAGRFSVFRVMQLKIAPQSLTEWFGLQLNLVPVPLLHGQIFPVVSKAVLVAADRGLFNAIGDGIVSVRELAQKCSLAEQPLEQLLEVLVSAGYLEWKGKGCRLSKMTRKWAYRGSPNDLSDLLVYNHRIVWKWMDHLETYLETGKGIDYHPQFGAEEWKLYQKAMRAVASMEAAEFARKCPVPANAVALLDVGGAPGLHVSALKARYSHLQAHILDLPAAIENLADGALPDVTYFKGDILSYDLPEETYDLVLISSLAHHFTQEQNNEIARRAARILKPGGVFVINDFVKPDARYPQAGLTGTSSNLFFGLTSTSGTWTVAEMQEWQTGAGLKPYKVIGYTGIPGRYQIVARKA